MPLAGPWALAYVILQLTNYVLHKLAVTFLKYLMIFYSTSVREGNFKNR